MTNDMKALIEILGEVRDEIRRIRKALTGEQAVPKKLPPPAYNPDTRQGNGFKPFDPVGDKS